MNSHFDTDRVSAHRFDSFAKAELVRLMVYWEHDDSNATPKNHKSRLPDRLLMLIRIRLGQSRIGRFPIRLSWFYRRLGRDRVFRFFVFGFSTLLHAGPGLAFAPIPEALCVPLITATLRLTTVNTDY
jgi:hypothetical protein